MMRALLSHLWRCRLLQASGAATELSLLVVPSLAVLVMILAVSFLTRMRAVPEKGIKRAGPLEWKDGDRAPPPGNGGQARAGDDGGGRQSHAGDNDRSLAAESGGEIGTLINEVTATGPTDVMEDLADAIREASEAIPGRMVETADRVAQIRECLEALRGRMVETLVFGYMIRETFAAGVMVVIFDYPIRETYAAGTTAEIVARGLLSRSTCRAGGTTDTVGCPTTAADPTAGPMTMVGHKVDGEVGTMIKAAAPVPPRREYNTEYDRLHGRLREVGCSLPEECSAWLYLDRLQLDEPQELNLLASVGNRRTNYTHMTDHDLESDEEDLLNGEEGIPEDVAEAYVTYQSAKDRYRAQQRGRGTTGDKGGSPDGQPAGGPERRPGEKRNSEHESRIKAMKAKSFCSGCGRKGHWHKDDACPLNKGESAAKGETGASVAMTTVLPADVFALKHVPNMLLGVADTACARTVAGTQWLQSYTNLLEEFGRKPVLQKECEAHRFGTGKVHYSSFYVIVAFRLGGFNIQVRTSIIAGDIPLLLSKTVLGKLGMVYDVQNGKADFKAINLMNYELTNTSSGHPAIPIAPVDVHSGGTPNLQVEDLRLQQAEQYTTVYAVAHHGPQAPKYSGIFYDKKLDPSTRDMLSQDRLQRDVFVTWWEKSKFDRDFWLETPYMWVRVHIVPRRAVFNPSTWRTGSTVQRDMLVSSIGDVRITECVCCKTGGWIESTVDRWLPGQIDQVSFPSLWVGRTVFYKALVPVSRMTKAQLLQEALRVGATVHHTWTVVELRATIRDHIDTFHEKTSGQKMKGLSSMNLPDLKEKAREMGVMVPDKITKGNLLRLIRSTLSTEGDMIMTIGRWKGSLYREIPDSYGSWAAGGGSFPEQLTRAGDVRPMVASPAAQQVGDGRDPGRGQRDGAQGEHPQDLNAIEGIVGRGEHRERQDAGQGPSGPSWEGEHKGNAEAPQLGDGGEGREDHGGGAEPRGVSGDSGPGNQARGAQGQSKKLKAVKFDVGPPGPTCGIGCHRQRKWDVGCCGEVCDEDRISEVRGYYNQAVNFSTTHEPMRNDGDAPGLSFAKAHDNMHNDHRDGVRNPCPLRFGDESFSWDDHSLEACHRLLGAAFTPSNSASLRPIQRREGGEEGELYLTVGMYTHGGVHGITRATKDNDAVVRYLNHFGRKYLGEQATWSSISITKNLTFSVYCGKKAETFLCVLV
ncbi:unnamed protein product [Symbiodinium sp. CCMP2592]|nr:unnamed protein product [Symbiodinium sp. CCMP2592]CAE7677279.1 unnamed protein product [Symbiodinium sp. CCMP2592]